MWREIVSPHLILVINRDIAGHERFGCMTHVYYKYAIAAVIIFDLTRPATFDAVLKVRDFLPSHMNECSRPLNLQWKEDLDSKVMLGNQQPVPCLLVANKCDRDDIQVDRSKLDQFCKDNNFVGWFQTSALENTGIGTAFLATSFISLYTLFFFNFGTDVHLTETAMNALGRHVVQVAKEAQAAPRPSDSLNLTAKSPREQEKEKSACCAGI